MPRPSSLLPELTDQSSDQSAGDQEARPASLVEVKSVAMEKSGSLEVPSSTLNISELIEDTSDSAVSSLASQLAGLENAIPLLNMDIMSFLHPATPDSPVPTGGLPIFPSTPALPVSGAPTAVTTSLHSVVQDSSAAVTLSSVKGSPDMQPPLGMCDNPLPSSLASQPVVEISTLATSKDVPDSVTGQGNPIAASSPAEYLDLDISSLIDPTKLLEGIPEDMAKSIQTIVQLDEETWK